MYIFPLKGGFALPYRNLLDLHIHSDNSKDADHSVTLICEKAIEKGIRAIAITDHCECLEYEEYGHSITCRQSAFEARKASLVFEGQLVVTSGVELGNPVRNTEAVDDVMKNNFDYVVASVHRIRGKKKSFRHLDYTREANRPEFLMPRYFDDVIETVEWNDFDSLAHLTYPIRYYPDELLAQFKLSGCEEQIRHILKTLAANGKALEINTGSKEYKTADIAGCTHPYFELVKLFKELGGEYVTVGSDAHNANDVGSGMEKAMRMAEEAGFKFITLYQRRTPLPIRIE